VGLKIEYPAGATPLDPDDAAGLIPGHITTQGQLNEWEYANVIRGEEWAFGTKQKNILSIEFIQTLHQKMFGDTWKWAGAIRTKETHPVGIAPERIRPELKTLLEDVEAQIKDGTWGIEEIAVRFHHRMVYIHPFPNGNGRFSRTITDLMLVQSGKDRFAWGADLDREGEARERYIAALRAADARDYSPLVALLKVRHGSAEER
jgi:Fic-DOC domain mobile mystery protein B